MLGTDAMIKFGLDKLAGVIKAKGKTSEGYVMEFTENEINDFVASKGQPFSILCLDDEQKGKVIKIIYSGE